MSTMTSGFTFQSAMAEITRGVVEAVCDRPGDSPARRSSRQHATAWTMSSFLPRDPVETMLAGHCVLFDQLLLDGVRDSLHGLPQDSRVQATASLHASGKMFLAHLKKFDQLRDRPAEALCVRPSRQPVAAEQAGGEQHGSEQHGSDETAILQDAQDFTLAAARAPAPPSDRDSGPERDSGPDRDSVAMVDNALPAAPLNRQQRRHPGPPAPQNRPGPAQGRSQTAPAAVPDAAAAAAVSLRESAAPDATVEPEHAATPVPPGGTEPEPIPASLLTDSPQKTEARETEGWAT